MLLLFVVALTGASFAVADSTCRRRTLEERWKISEPTFVFDDMSFTLDYQISDFIISDDQVKYTLMEQSCTTPYTGQGLIPTKGARIGLGNSLQEVGIAIDVDTSVISTDYQVYTDVGFVNNQKTANIDFCMRFSLHTPLTAGDDEVNFIEVIVGLTVDLTDGFQIGDISVEALDPCNKDGSPDAFVVDAYFCDDGTENTPIVSMKVLNQGELVKVCVRPEQRALDLGIRMNALQSFTWELVGGTMTQPAIVDYEEASNLLTQMYCSPGYGVCHFETMLFAGFFTVVGNVMGFGVADMQFGGESPTSVSPKIARRALVQEDRDILTRRLQDGVTPVPSAEFNLQATSNMSSMRETSRAHTPQVWSCMMGVTSSISALLFLILEIL